MKIAIVAPSSVVAKNELKMGLEILKEQKMDFQVAKQVSSKYLFYAGKLQDRFHALIDAVYDPEISIVWSARGGYGATQLLPLLDTETKKRGLPPHKLFIGYSDSTCLLEFARTRWNFSALHAVMPGHRGLLYAKPRELRVLFSWMRGIPMPPAWTGVKLKWMGKAPSSSISGELVGGNLSLLNDTVGTEWEVEGQGKIVFLEEVTETPSRLDRMVHHLIQAGTFNGAKALVLGSFTDCFDRSPRALKYIKDSKKRYQIATEPKPKDLEVLRPVISDKKVLEEVFRPIYEDLGVPVAFGFPAGHGDSNAPLPYGAKYELSPSGDLALRSWTWLKT